jgi:hypothetical protein
MLIFSRFKATPQSVAALISLEVERKFVGKGSLKYKEAWKKRHLNPKPNQGPTLALFHPSPFLIRAVDPLDIRDGASIRQLRARARQQIIQALPPSIKPEAPNKRDDRRRKPVWAVLAAIEAAQKQPFAREFVTIQREWAWVAPKDTALQSLLSLRKEAEPISWLSKAELDALVEMALGGPGVVTGRALYRHLPDLFDYKAQHYRKLARFCWAKLRTYLDRPVFWAVLPGEDAADKYQRACLEGCLEAVLDEHFWLRKSKVSSVGLIDDLSAALSANVGNFGFHGQAKRRRSASAATPPSRSVEPKARHCARTRTQTNKLQPALRKSGAHLILRSGPISSRPPQLARKVWTFTAGVTVSAIGICVQARWTWSSVKDGFSVSED